MLKLINIKKDYEVADSKVEALKGLSINFRQNEFVSILGPSGCGKTTMLNIIGGLDHATSGDLQINGKSTKNYNDRDWDVYRNHRIGFIFQSYNLIPHQTVLQNVELALTIAGIDKETRVARAKEVLDKVGLHDQYNKKPNQLSGGQSQRVSIARALVNNPEILLADEPTGALDSKTSVQIMDLLQEIAKERLVIMVTHNPEIAEQYSTRLVRLLDGTMIEDTKPFSDEDEAAEAAAIREKIKAEKEAAAAALALAEKQKGYKKNRKEKAKMSMLTSFRLSMQNIFTKKKRTALIAFAGSIGIVGVSTVLSVSIGLQGFITNMQNDMLAGNPITITKQAFDVNSISNMTISQKLDVVQKGDYINVGEMIKTLDEQMKASQNFMVENDIDKYYVQYLNEMPQDYYAAITLDQGIDVAPSLYTDFHYPSQDSGRMTSITGIKSAYSSVLASIPNFGQYASLVDMLNNPFAQAPDVRKQETKDYLLSQYDVLYTKPGSDGFARNKHEIMVVLDKDRQIADLTLGQLGYYTQDEFLNLVNRAVNEVDFDPSIYDGGQVEYDKLAAKKYTWYNNDTIFTPGPGAIGEAKIAYNYLPYAESSWTGGLELEIVGILEPKESLNFGMLSSGVYYSAELTEHILEENHNSDINAYLRNKGSDEFSGVSVVALAGSTSIMNQPLPFPLPNDMVIPVSGEVLAYNYEYVAYKQTTPKTTVGTLSSSMNIGSMISLLLGQGSETNISNYSAQALGGGVSHTLEAVYQTDVDGEFNIDGDGNKIIDHYDVTYDLDENGNVIGLPSEISVYSSNFRQKDKALKYLDEWNSDNTITLQDGTVLKAVDADGTRLRRTVTYTDILSLIMTMISSLLTVITVALIGFTSLSLVVSSLMIAIITYVSVVERIKEIGVIRSLGGSKNDVSNLFIAETFIIGFSSGVLGLIVTYIISGVINLITIGFGVGSIANLPWWTALIMLGISIFLTLISGLIPSRSAAKKDPVEALRSE